MAKTNSSGIALFIGNNDTRLINQALNSMDFIKDVRVIRNASLNGTGLQKMTVAKGTRPLDLNVETRGENQRSWTGRKLMVYPGMKIIDLVAEELYLTWQSDMVVPGAKQVPFAQWVWEQEMAKISSEINDNIYLSSYHGDALAYDAATVYTGGISYVKFGAFSDIYKCVTTTTAGQDPTNTPAKWLLVNELVTCNGWGKIIADEIALGTSIVPITTGALTSSNALDKIELMYTGMTEAHKNLGGVFRVSANNYRNYLLHERTVYGNAATPEMGVGIKSVYGNPKWVIQGCTWMGTSGRVIATQKDNLVYGCSQEADSNKVAKTIETLHGTKSVVKYVHGTEIADLETLYVNDIA